MKDKRKGFASLECIVSLSIISLALYIISTTLYSGYNIVNNTKKEFEMLNIAKSEIEAIKYNIKKDKNYIINDTKEFNNYKINTIIEKDDYYKCHKINVEVMNEEKNIKITSYAFKQ